jgi:hypothetical protein
MTACATKWLRLKDDADVEVLDAPPGDVRHVPFAPAEGSAEAMLVALVATWSAASSGIVFPDARNRWLVISSTGPGDLRGYALPDDGGCYRASLEAKVVRKGGKSIVKSALANAMEQASKGLSRIYNSYAKADETFLGVKPEGGRGAVVVACDGCGLSEEVAEEASAKAAANTKIPGLRNLRTSIIEIQRFAGPSGRFVRWRSCFDRWFKVTP